MTIRTPNRTEQTGIFYTGSPDVLELEDGAPTDGMKLFSDQATAESWADGDPLFLSVVADSDNWMLCLGAWRTATEGVELGAVESSAGTVADGASVIVTSVLTQALMEFVANSDMLGQFPDLSGLDQDGNSRGAYAVNLQTARLADDVVASGDRAVAIGYNTEAASLYGCAVGANARASGIGSVGLKGTAHGQLSISLSSEVYSADSVGVRGFFCVPTDDWSDQYEAGASGGVSVFATPPIDLGVPPDWAASTSYDNGDVVKPTAGGTVQYRAWTEYGYTSLLHFSESSGASEPTWPGDGGDVDLDNAGNALWIGIDPTSGYATQALPTWLEFYPTSIAFVCQDYSATTGTPTISVGTASSPTLLLNAATVGITATGQRYEFTLPNPCLSIPEGEAIVVTMDGAASAGRMVGRFVFTGNFIGPLRRT